MVRSKKGGDRHLIPPVDAPCRSRSRPGKPELPATAVAIMMMRLQLLRKRVTRRRLMPHCFFGLGGLGRRTQSHAASNSSFDISQLQQEPACVPSLPYCELLTKCIIAEYGTGDQGKRILSSMLSFCRSQTALKFGIVDGSLEAAAKPPENIGRGWRKDPRELMQTLQNGDGVPLNGTQKENVFSAVTPTLTLCKGRLGLARATWLSML